MLDLDSSYFAGSNPFDIDNVTARRFEIMDFAGPGRGIAPSNLARGLAFLGGWQLTQVKWRSDLSGGEDRYWVDRTNLTLFVTPFGNKTPPDVPIEIPSRTVTLKLR